MMEHGVDQRGRRESRPRIRETSPARVQDREGGGGAAAAVAARFLPMCLK